jgi:hypothetical protein
LPSYQISFVVKSAWALKRGKWPQKGVIWGRMYPKMVQFHPKMAQISKKFQKNILNARSKNLEKGDLLSQTAADTAPFFF